jgi:hypothetical protein
MGRHFQNCGPITLKDKKVHGPTPRGSQWNLIHRHLTVNAANFTSRIRIEHTVSSSHPPVLTRVTILRTPPRVPKRAEYGFLSLVSRKPGAEHNSVHTSLTLL